MKTRLKNYILTRPLFGCALLAFSALPAAPAYAQTSQPATASKTPPASTADDEAIELSTFVVTDRKDRGYRSDETTSGLRIVQDLKNLANSITVINEQFISDVAALSIEDMTKWTVTGEADADPTRVNGSVQLVFRGVRNTFAARNGWIWYGPVDSFATERVEIVRGPNSFLYGEADIGGFQNIVTKRGRFDRDFSKARMVVGSFALQRGELDINRRITDKLAVRVSGVQHNNETWFHHGNRDYRGLYAAAAYRPFKHTMIRLSGEYTKDTQVRPSGFYIDQFSFYDPTKPDPLSSSDTTLLNNFNGVAYIPSSGVSFRQAGLRRSRGTGLAIIDQNILPRELQFQGPGSSAKIYSRTVTLEVEQNIGRNLSLLFSSNFYQQYAESWGHGRAIYRDINQNLPDGKPNPYYNELYTEYTRGLFMWGNRVLDARLSAVYNLNTKWFKQQIVASAQQHQDQPNYRGGWPSEAARFERIDPANPLFLGTVNFSPTTTADQRANSTTLNQNSLVRRFYLRDGDNATLTDSKGPVPGLSNHFRNPSPGGNRHSARFYTPGLSIGASGSYFKDHLFTLIGYRRDTFRMRINNGIISPAPTGKVFLIDEPISEPRFIGPHYFNNVNFGGVVRINDMIAFSYNRANSSRASAGIGDETFVPNTYEGVPEGKGDDYGVRLSFFGDRLQIFGTRYNNFEANAYGGGAPGTVRDELLAIFPETFNPSGVDTQKATTKGTEVELVANPTPNWRLMANFSTNKLVTEGRLPRLKGFRAEANRLGHATPATDDYIASRPDGVPNPGYVKNSVNVFTRYSFAQGRLEGLYVGGGVNWRDQTYRGTADLDRSGVRVPVWAPSYYLVTLMGGYSARIADRMTTFQLNVNNLFDKNYYRSGGVGSGWWGEPRTFRLSVTVEL